MIMENLTLVKLGGSIITDKKKAFALREGVLNRLAKEVHSARQKRDFPLVIGHGGGSFPHRPAHEYETHKGFINENSKKGFAIVQDAASQLNRFVVRALLDAGEDAVSFQPSAGALAESSRIRHWDLTVLERLLSEGFLPVPFGDPVLDSKQGCSIASTEELLDFIAGNAGAERIIVVGEVDGVFDSFPPEEGEAPIERLDRARFEELKDSFKGASGTDVTGGMLHKVERMLEVAEKGINVQIINGLVEGCLERALKGEKVPGTFVG